MAHPYSFVQKRYPASDRNIKKYTYCIKPQTSQKPYPLAVAHAHSSREGVPPSPGISLQNIDLTKSTTFLAYELVMLTTSNSCSKQKDGHEIRPDNDFANSCH